MVVLLGFDVLSRSSPSVVVVAVAAAYMMVTKVMVIEKTMMICFSYTPSRVVLQVPLIGRAVRGLAAPAWEARDSPGHALGLRTCTGRRPC